MPCRRATASLSPTPDGKGLVLVREKFVPPAYDPAVIYYQGSGRREKGAS